MVNTMKYFDNSLLYFQRLGGLLKIWGFKYLNMQMFFQIGVIKSFLSFFIIIIIIILQTTCWSLKRRVELREKQGEKKIDTSERFLQEF